MFSSAETLKSIVKEAETCFKANKIYEAGQLLSSVLTQNFNVLFLRGKIFYAKKDFFRSLKDLEICISLSPKEKWTYFWSAKCCFQMLNWEKTEKYLEICEKFIIEEMKENKQEVEGDFKEFTEEVYNLQTLLKQRQLPTLIKTPHYPKNPHFSFLKTLFENGAFINKIEISTKNTANRCVIASEEIR